ncbi:disintegrin and metalloproteinase domain-containing protein 18-like [Eudromia elegans]
MVAGWPALSQITVPRRLLPANATAEPDTVSYAISIEGRPYTIHLQRHLFLSEDFRIYTYNEKGWLDSELGGTQENCYYRGYVEGVPSSMVTLSTCSGLRGLLQLENVSYGIEPLVYSPAFEHSVYPMSNENTAGFRFANLHRARGEDEATAEDTILRMGEPRPASPAAKSPSYVEMYVVTDKALYDYLGSDRTVVTQRLIQVFGFVNSMFGPLNVTVVLSSLEFWSGEDKVPTAGEAHDVLQQFLQWKQAHLVLRPHDVAYLFVYKEQPLYVGATVPGQACRREDAGGVAVFQKGASLELFSIVLAQLLGLSLGMSYDRSGRCRCPGAVCVMSNEALCAGNEYNLTPIIIIIFIIIVDVPRRSGGVKSFSSCSAAALESFLLQRRGDCLSNRPRLSGPAFRKAAVCGNGVVERGEQCDCGSVEECLADECCGTDCHFKPGVKCATGLCCDACQFKPRNSKCRPAADAQCDLPEFCNGSSAACPADLYVQDGSGCERGTGYCYGGRCRSADLQCQRLYGRGSRNAPVVCYEEVNSQRDRFGNCGLTAGQNFRPCAWRNLRCGKLICTYPHRHPLASTAAAVIYAQVRDYLCVSVDYVNVSSRSSSLVEPGTKCGPGKVCINGTCHPDSVLGYDCNSDVKCHGHGVCNNRKNCHCHPGWKPPDCRMEGSSLGGSIDSGLQMIDAGFSLRRALQATAQTWLLLAFSLLLPALAGGTILVLKRKELGRLCRLQPLPTEE